MENYEKPFVEAKEWLATKQRADGTVSFEHAARALDLAEMKSQLAWDEEFEQFKDHDEMDELRESIEELENS